MGMRNRDDTPVTPQEMLGMAPRFFQSGDLDDMREALAEPAPSRPSRASPPRGGILVLRRAKGGLSSSA